MDVKFPEKKHYITLEWLCLLLIVVDCGVINNSIFFINITLYTFEISSRGVNISERKSGTERTKKRKKGELVCFSHRQGAQRSTSPITPKKAGHFK